MNKSIKTLIYFILVLFIASATSCLGLKKQVGHTKFQMLNKLGAPTRILNSSNGDQIYVYFYEDYSQNHYPSVVGFMYIGTNNKVYKVEKYSTRFSLDEFIKYR
jgi:hypothetical protein